MQDSQSDRNSKRAPAPPSRAAYLWAAALAAVAGFAAIYVSSGLEGNAPLRAVAPRPAGLALAPAAETARANAPAPRGSSGAAEHEKREPAVRLAAAEAPRPASGSGLKGLNRGAMAAFLVHKSPKVLPEITFVGEGGTPHKLSDWKGRVILVNIWATWCAPCRKEMPALDRLKAALGGPAFDVLAISIDRSGLDKPRRFLEQVKVKHLALYNDKTGKTASLLKAFGIPSTLLIDRQGREIGRLTGPAEWDSPEAKALVSAAIGAGGP